MIYAFVYGTLRVGEYNYQWASGDVVDEILDVTTKGDIYFVSEDGGYPVAKLDGDGNIIGDVLVYPEHSLDWKRIYDMESGAGYVLRDIQVALGNGKMLDAVAWDFLYQPRGPKIPHGDWARAYHAYELSEIS